MENDKIELGGWKKRNWNISPVKASCTRGGRAMESWGRGFSRDIYTGTEARVAELDLSREVKRLCLSFSVLSSLIHQKEAGQGCRSKF